MHKEVLYKNQIEIISILEIFNKSFYLAWWTAIALILWHRKSLDFDLFSSKQIDKNKIVKKLKENDFKISRILVDNSKDELSLIISWVKITFLYYPFDIKLENTNKFEKIKLPTIETLWAMKFYTLWRRWKRKDYVDIYSILKSGISFNNISKLTESIFKWAYNEKLLREQLCYFDDIDFSEEVDYIWENIWEDEIKSFLENISLKID